MELASPPPRPEFEVVPPPVAATGGLTVDGLVKGFDQVTAVDRLSMAVHPGEILALLGPNGAGKTTTLLCLAGLLRPDAGTIAWEGRRLGVERTRLMALIPETPEVYEMLTVWEHLVFVARAARWMPPGRRRPSACWSGSTSRTGVIPSATACPRGCARSF